MEDEIVEFVDDFIKNGVAGLVAVDGDQEIQGAVMLDDRHGFGAEFFEAGVENG